MHFISEAESASLVDHEIAFTAIQEALVAASTSAAVSFPVVHGHGSDNANSFSIKASATESLAGLKVGSYWPGNMEHGLPRHNSLILLLDQECGKMSAAIEAGKVNAYRTAAADAVAAHYLSRENSSVVAVFGTGHQARFECMAVAKVRKIRQLIVVGRDITKAQNMAKELSLQGLNAEASDAQSACQRADIIITATPARSPLFKAEWVKPGTHIASMGSDAPGKQELPPELFHHSMLFCDLPDQSRRIGEFQHAHPDRNLIAIGDVISGKHAGRISPDAITVFDSSGLSVQDLYMGYYLLNKWLAAKEQQRR
ncbi:ornithine cyclodeaminase family protein [Escherichia coli]|uniref:ornithine cyclodeaminase family protein n=1 Tax=Escherichia coli TaxID=562 RepID=UPI0013658278|nr:ornithine cyclodeaminase family protein [Escherichia coli]MWT74200.1 ornithine cyclodeaminase family protein [Escherichia coli]